MAIVDYMEKLPGRAEKKQTHAKGGYFLTPSGFQVETYGSDKRKNKGSRSQTILFTGEALNQISEVLEELKGAPKSKNKPVNQKQTNSLNLILYGPPGTGKTYKTKELAVDIASGDKIQDREILNIEYEKLRAEGNISFVTFHQSYSYEEFVEGIKPDIDSTEQVTNESGETSSDIVYVIKDGVFKNLCAEAQKRPKENFVLIIDEINRGNISKILGELITLLEEDKRLGNEEALKATLPYSGESFGVPNNLYIIGTMNTADRSIAFLDTALRRRFEFIEMMPDSKVLDRMNNGFTDFKLGDLLSSINAGICKHLDRDHQIGHSYFMNVSNLDQLSTTFRNKICPLLEEYFHDRRESIYEVLNKNAFFKNNDGSWQWADKDAFKKKQHYLDVFSNNKDK